MQNTEFKAQTSTKKEFSDLAVTDETIDEPSNYSTIAQQIQSEAVEEQQPKVKSRSRFTVALRNLSKPKPKKDKERDKSIEKLKQKDKARPSSKIEGEIKEQQRPLLATVENIASVSEANTDADAKSKKKSLTRRLLLGGLKKSKECPRSLDTTDEIRALSSNQKQDEAATPTTSSTVQITITGKKVEPAVTIDVKSKSKAAKSASSETEYLTPIPTKTAIATPAPTPTTATATKTSWVKPSKSTTTTTTVTTKDTSSSRTTKVIVAKVGKEPLTNASNVASAKKKLKSKKVSPPSTITSSKEEKIVITESTRDTPPRERAPAKPTRANASPIATDTAAAFTTAVQYSSNGATVRKPSTRTPSVTSKKNLRAVGTVRTATVIEALPSRKEYELMQHQQQRGHRLARPTTATHNQQFQSEAFQQSDQPQHLQLQINQVDSDAAPIDELPFLSALLQPPVSAHSTPTQRHSTYDFVATANLSEGDEYAVSSAESAHAVQEFTSSPKSLSISRAQFVVGSAIRPPASEYEETFSGANCAQQLSSSESQRDSSRRRPSYANELQTLDDHDSIEGRRETLHYQPVISDEYSCDSQSEEGCESSENPMPAFGDLTMDQEMEPTIMSPTLEKREHLYKILVIGELGTGKTSFIKRYVHQFFSQNYRATIGVDFALKVLHWDANTIVRLQLWDIAGQERFGNMTRVYYKEAVGAFIVFDVTRSGTFDCVSKWKEDLDSKVQLPDGSPIPCILLANKSDQEKQGIVTQPEKMDEYVRENGFAGWFETSAKENINIDDSARALVNKILINDKLITAADLADNNKFNLNNASDETSSEVKNKCAC